MTGTAADGCVLEEGAALLLLLLLSDEHPASRLPAIAAVKVITVHCLFIGLTSIFSIDPDRSFSSE
ncbi:hypothetical protein D3C86_2076550 [compost metagenome]